MWRNQRGLSLVEVIVSTALLVLAITPLLSLFVTSRLNVEDSTHRAEALAAARAITDEVVARPAWADIKPDGPTPYTPDPQFTYTVTVAEPRTYLKNVTVKLEWQEASQTRSLELSTAVYKREP